ncbi:MAG: hypothetical protein UDP13_07545 [Butyricicoccus sp.]|nr:hypothetical protein [Butyricicoccus sp.]
MSRNFSIILQTRVSAAVFCIPALPQKAFPHTQAEKSKFQQCNENAAMPDRSRYRAEHRQAAVCPSTARTPKKPDADMPAYFLLYRIDRPAEKIETATTAAATAKTAEVLFVFICQ